MKLSVHPSLILWLSIFFYVSPELLLPFFLASAFHELGHFLVLKKLQKPPIALNLSFSGAAMETPFLNYREELLSAAAGPIFSLLLAALWPLWPVTGMYSMILGVFNLLPVAGLDGSRILSAFLHMRCSPHTARTLCWVISIAACLVLLLWATILAFYFHFGLWPILFTGIFSLKRTLQTEGKEPLHLE